jgi:hypothetical protein
MAIMDKGLAGTSLGLGIGAILIGWIPILGWILIIAALVVSSIAVAICKTPEEGKGLAIAGLVCSIVAVLVTSLFATGMLAYFGVFIPSYFHGQCAINPPFTCPKVGVGNDGLWVTLENSGPYRARDIVINVSNVSNACENIVSVPLLEANTQQRIKLCEKVTGPIVKAKFVINYYGGEFDTFNVTIGSVYTRSG